MRLFRKRYHPPGTAPGTLNAFEVQDDQPRSVQLIEYSQDHIKEIQTPEMSKLGDSLHSDHLTWLRVNGLPDSDWMKALGGAIEIHPLAQEDILNGGQRSKIEPYDSQFFIVIDVPDLKNKTLSIDQLYILWHKNYLITFYTGRRDMFDPVLKRLHSEGTRARKFGLDYLIYAILDLAIDQAFPILEHLGTQLENLEEELMDGPDENVLHKIHQIKRQIIHLRRAFWPQRDVISQLMRDEDHWFSQSVRLYLRDCYDHTIQIMELIESYRDTSSSLHDLYLSSASMRMNDIMKVLAIISTVFIPLTFIAGIYGMNFQANSKWAMPELSWAYGYPMVWCLFIIITIGMLIWFRKKRWI